MIYTVLRDARFTCELVGHRLLVATDCPKAGSLSPFSTLARSILERERIMNIQNIVTFFDGK